MIETNQYWIVTIVCELCGERFTINSESVTDTRNAAFGQGWYTGNCYDLCISCGEEQKRLNEQYNGITEGMIK